MTTSLPDFYRFYLPGSQPWPQEWIDYLSTTYPGVTARGGAIQAPLNAAWLVERELRDKGIQYKPWTPRPRKLVVVGAIAEIPELRAVDPLTKTPMAEFLTPYQLRETMKFASHDGVLFQWSAGSGKTCGSIIWALLVKSDSKIVVVTGAKGRLQWQAQITRYTTCRSSLLLGTGYVGKAEIVFERGVSREKASALRDIYHDVALLCGCGVKHAHQIVQRYNGEAYDVLARVYLPVGHHELGPSRITFDVVEPTPPDDSRFLIVGWETLPYHLNTILGCKPETVILDEVHTGKSHRRVEIVPVSEAALATEPKAKQLPDGRWIKYVDLENRAAATKKLCHSVKRRCGTTATPVKDRIRDLWAQLDYLVPWGWGSYWPWAKRYCSAVAGPFGGMDDKSASNLDELAARVSFVRSYVSMAESHASLPPKRRETIWLSPDVQQRSDEGVLEEIAAAKVARDSVRSIANLRLVEACSRKRKAIIDMVVEDVNGGANVLLFTARRADVEAYRKALERKPKGANKLSTQCWTYFGTGADSLESRNQAALAFMQRPSHSFFCCTGYSFGEQIDLQNADIHIMAMLPMTVSELAQWEGRCVVEGQLILTDRGAVPIEQVKIGDRVLSNKGKWQKVKAAQHKFAQPFGKASTPITELNFVGQIEPLRLTFNHRVLIKRGAKVFWLWASQVLPGDRLVTPRYRGVRQTRPMLSFPEEHRSEARHTKHAPSRIVVDHEVAWFLGYFTGDGSTTLNGSTNQICVSGNTTTKRKFLRRAERLLQKWGLHTTRKKHWSKGEDIMVASIEMTRWFRELFGAGSRTKHVPLCVFEWSKPLIKSFLTGYSNADGRSGDLTSSHWATTSPTLALQLSILLAALGKCSTNGTGVRGGTRATIREIGVTKEAELDTSFVYRRVNSVATRFPEKSSVKVYDLEVANDGSFVCGNVVVHNSHRLGGRSVLYKYMIAEGTADERVVSLLLDKLPAVEKMGMEGLDNLRPALTGDQDALIAELAKQIVSGDYERLEYMEAT